MSLPYMNIDVGANSEYIIKLDPGKDNHSEGTFECDQYKGCLYCQDGRCVYNIATIKQRTSRACYEDDKMADSEYN